MIRAVLDTNILASGFVRLTSPTSAPSEIMRRWGAGQFELVTSRHILVELERVFGQPYFRALLAPVESEAALTRLAREAEVIQVNDTAPRVARHKADDAVIATAVDGGAPYLVTGDKLLRRLARTRDVAILTPVEFLEVLDRERSTSGRRP